MNMMMPTEKLLPNEIRISVRSGLENQVRHVLDTFQMGYSHCKMVGRGQAAERAFDVVGVIQRKMPGLKYDISETKSLNKMGMVVREVHILISSETSSSRSTAMPK